MAKQKEAGGGLPPRKEWQRYVPHLGSNVRLAQAISISATGTLTISADLAVHLGDSPFIVMWAWPTGKVEKQALFIQVSDGGEVGCWKGQIGDNGARRYSAKSAAHQFGIDTPGQGQMIPARWDAVEKVIVGDLSARTLRPAPRARVAKADPPPAANEDAAAAKGGPRYEGHMNCPGCGKCVAYRMVGGVRKLRAHKAPDGVECLGEAYDDGD